MIVFPELALMGYPIHDTIDRYPFIVDENIRYLKQIAKFTQDITAIIGFVEKREDVDRNCGKKYYNSLAVIKMEKLIQLSENVFFQIIANSMIIAILNLQKLQDVSMKQI